MAQNDIGKYLMVAIGGSAGSLDIILKIVSLLPTDSGASFVIIVHRKNGADSILPNLLSTRTTMKIKEVEDKEPIQPNSIYIAPPDYHLLIENKEIFSLDSSEKIHHCRPSIDVSFESIAQVFGAASLGILLSGANADGAAGLFQIKRAGGLTVAQDPLSADIAYMPQQAINMMAVNEIVDAQKLPEYIKRTLFTTGR